MQIRRNGEAGGREFSSRPFYEINEVAIGQVVLPYSSQSALGDRCVLKTGRLGPISEFFLSDVLFPIVCLNLDQPSFIAFGAQSNFAPYSRTSGMLDCR